MTALHQGQSLEAFYAAEPARRRSGEVDFGVHWRNRTALTWPTWRVSWIRDTGEVYAVTFNGPAGGQGDVHLLGVADHRSELERRLEGWTDQMHDPAGLDWIRLQLEGGKAPAPVRSHREAARRRST